MDLSTLLIAIVLICIALKVFKWTLKTVVKIIIVLAIISIFIGV